jgi:hypothetical protein
MKTAIRLIAALALLAIVMLAHGSSYYQAVFPLATNDAPGGLYGLYTNGGYCSQSSSPTNWIDFQWDSTNAVWLVVTYQRGNTSYQNWSLEFDPADYAFSTNAEEPVIVEFDEPQIVVPAPALPTNIPAPAIIDAVVFSWPQPTNYDGDFMLLCGEGPLGPWDRHFAVTGTNAIVTAQRMNFGTWYWNYTFASGTEQPGEAQELMPAAESIGVMVQPNVVVTAGMTTTNSLIYSSTDFGQSWKLVGTNILVMSPVEPRRFFTSPNSNLSIGISNSAAVLNSQ